MAASAPRSPPRGGAVYDLGGGAGGGGGAGAVPGGGAPYGGGAAPGGGPGLGDAQYGGRHTHAAPFQTHWPGTRTAPGGGAP
jgi:hypothetical protein